MSSIVNYSAVEEKIITIRGQGALLDSSVAELYGVETRVINQAVGNNPDKFPDGYILLLTAQEWSDLKSKLLISSWGGRRTLPKAFTEKGLYMLATILKGTAATQTTIAIVETFTKIRELSKTIGRLPDVQEEHQQKALMQRSGEILAEVLDDNALHVVGDETTIEINLAMPKIKHTTKREKRSGNAEKNNKEWLA